MSNWFNGLDCLLHLSQPVYISPAPYICLYLGVPLLSISTCLDNELANSGYVNLLDISEDKGKPNHDLIFAALKKGITKLYNHYEERQLLASRGSLWIEDRWSPEMLKTNILMAVQNFLNTSTNLDFYSGPDG